MEKLLSEAIVEELSCEESDRIIGGYATTITVIAAPPQQDDLGAGLVELSPPKM